MVVLFLLLFALPIKTKQAIDIEIATEYSTLDIDSLVGQTVTLLCEHADWQVTEPPKYEFVVLAIANEKGIFEPLPVNREGKIVGIPGLYVYPKIFIGRAVKEYYFGFNNKFVFYGVLSKAPITKNGSTFGDYKIVLKSWNIVYPVYHWEFHLGPNNEFYRRHIFVFDYLI
jgi:hypothetical protein